MEVSDEKSAVDRCASLFSCGRDSCDAKQLYGILWTMGVGLWRLLRLRRLWELWRLRPRLWRLLRLWRLPRLCRLSRLRSRLLWPPLPQPRMVRAQSLPCSACSLSCKPPWKSLAAVSIGQVCSWLFVMLPLSISPCAGADAGRIHLDHCIIALDGPSPGYAASRLIYRQPSKSFLPEGVRGNPAFLQKSGFPVAFSAPEFIQGLPPALQVWGGR